MRHILPIDAITDVHNTPLDGDDEDEAAGDIGYSNLSLAEGITAYTTSGSSMISKRNDANSETRSPSEASTEVSGEQNSDSIESKSWDTMWWPPEVGIDTEELEKEAQVDVGSWQSSSSLNCRMCPYCRVFFDSWQKAVEIILDESNKIRQLYTPFYHSMDQLGVSATLGCHLCAYFLSIFRMERRIPHISGRQIRHVNRDPNIYEKPQGYLYLHHKKSQYSEHPGAMCLGFQEHNALVKILSGELWQPTLGDIGYGERIGPQLFADLTVENKINFDESIIALARNWLEDCRQNHKNCAIERQNHLPTRLIKLNKNHISLVLSFEQENCTVYATLSHCWGRLPIFRLLQSNISQLLKEIPYDCLNKTFRDAIEIARSLDLPGCGLIRFVLFKTTLKIGDGNQP